MTRYEEWLQERMEEEREEAEACLAEWLCNLDEEEWEEVWDGYAD